MEATIQELKHFYFNYDALREPTYKLSRLDSRSLRYYFKTETKKVKGFHGETYKTGKKAGQPKKTTKETLEPVFYKSLTSLIKASVPTSKYLVSWIAEHGEEEARRIAEERANYGTLLHICYGSLLVNRSFDLETLELRIEAYCADNGIDVRFVEEWYEELAKDVKAFEKFVREYNVRPLAIEVLLASDKFEVATAIDLICIMAIPEKGFHGETYKTTRKGYYNAGDPKESVAPVDRLAIVDFKSGKKGFWEEHEIQLEGCKAIVEENYPDLKVERLYNFAPANWRTSPDYKLKDQTGSVLRKKFALIAELAKIDEAKDPSRRSFIRFGGVIELDKDPINNFEFLSLPEYVKAKAERSSEDIIKQGFGKASNAFEKLTEALKNSVAKETTSYPPDPVTEEVVEANRASLFPEEGSGEGLKRQKIALTSNDKTTTNETTSEDNNGTN